MDALIQGSSNKKRLQGGKLSRFYAQEALSFIEQNYALPITVEDMANRCNLDRSYFGKVFKDMIGQSPQDFLIRYRMSKATSLLTSTRLDIQTSFIFPEHSVTFTGCHQDNIANRTNYCPESQAGYVSVYFSS